MGSTSRQVRRFLWLLPAAALLLLWQGLAGAGWLNPALLPSPWAIFHALARGFSPGGDESYRLLKDLGASLWRLGLGVALALLVGLPLGLLMGVSRPVRTFCHPLLSVLMPVPAIVWTPLLMLFLGLDTRPIVVTVALGAIFPIAYNTLLGVQRVPRQQLWVMRSVGGGAWWEFGGVLLPGALPYILTGTKTGVGYGWRALVAAEMIAASSRGLGYTIFYAREYMFTDVIFAGILLIALAGLTIERGVLGAVERLTVERWGVHLR